MARDLARTWGGPTRRVTLELRDATPRIQEEGEPATEIAIIRTHAKALRLIRAWAIWEAKMRRDQVIETKCDSDLKTTVRSLDDILREWQTLGKGCGGIGNGRSTEATWGPLHSSSWFGLTGQPWRRTRRRRRCRCWMQDSPFDRLDFIVGEGVWDSEALGGIWESSEVQG